MADIVADLAARLNVGRQAITLVRAEPVIWDDAALGCPLPGETYAQVVTPGFRVLLAVHNKLYEYHADAGQRAVLRERPADLQAPPPKSADDRTPWQPVDANPTVIIS